MGIELVKAAVGHPATSRLSGNAYKVLICMATTALDKASNGRPGGLYFGGWDALAMTLGHADSGRNSSGHKAVKRAISELRQGGHITPMTKAFAGSRQSYLVHPGGLAKGDQSDPAVGAQSDPAKGGQNGPQSGPKMTPPRKNTGLDAELKQDEPASEQPKPQTATGDNADEQMVAHKFKGAPGSDCLACGGRYANRRLHPLHLIRAATA